MYEKFKEIQLLPSYKILFKFLKEKERRIFWNEVFNFLQFYYSVTKEFKFDQEIFDLVYQKLEKFMFTRNRSSMFLSPLQNFESDIDEFSLDGDIKIRSISPLEIHRIMRYTTPMTLGHPQNTKFTLEKIHRYKEPTDGWEDAFDSRKDILSINHDFEMVAIALRLFKKGDLGTPLRHIEVPLDWGVSGGSGIHQSMFAPFFAIGEKYKLTKDEIPLFQEYWKGFRTKEISNRVQVALNRFKYLYERKNPEDNIIDCAIALEALFGSESRISMMVSLKAAFLLKEDKNQVKEIFTFIRKTYDIRSDIVHGRKVEIPIKVKDKEYQNLREFVLYIQELLRLSIRKYLDDEITEEKKRRFELIEMLELKEGNEIIDTIFNIV